MPWKPHRRGNAVPVTPHLQCGPHQEENGDFSLAKNAVGKRSLLHSFRSSFFPDGRGRIRPRMMFSVPLLLRFSFWLILE